VLPSFLMVLALARLKGASKPVLISLPLSSTC